MKPITICLPFYLNQGMLQYQMRNLAGMAKDLRHHLRLIVVDDGSPYNPARDVWGECGVQAELYRIMVDVRWNQDAARNIGVKNAKTDWVLLTDMDHVPPEGTLRALCAGFHEDNRVYNFERQTLNPDKSFTEYKPHPNSWFMTTKTYWKIGGYDERFAGLYGTDADFKERVTELSGVPIRLPLRLTRVPRETIPDASTTTYQRKAPEDGAFKDMRRKRNATPGWKPEHFRFPWERVA